MNDKNDITVCNLQIPVFTCSCNNIEENNINISYEKWFNSMLLACLCVGWDQYLPNSETIITRVTEISNTFTQQLKTYIIENKDDENFNNINIGFFIYTASVLMVSLCCGNSVQNIRQTSLTALRLAHNAVQYWRNITIE